MKKRLKQLIQKGLASMGYAIVNLQADPQRATMQGAIEALANRRPTFQTVIDVGASDGRWARLLLPHFPNRHYLLVDAQEVHRPELEHFCRQQPNAQFVLAAAGESQGQIYFDASKPFEGKAAYTPFAANNIVVPMTTLDHEVTTRQLPGPYLLKLDTHGFELPILRGAVQTLLQTEVVVMECYNYKIAPESLHFWEMCHHLQQMGFRCIDLADPLYRPFDNSLWQIDLVFMRAELPGFSYFKYE